MSEIGNVIFAEDFETKRRHEERKNYINVKLKEIPKSYKSDIKNYIEFCYRTNQDENIESLLDYLFVSVTEQKVKFSTWEKRLYAIKKYLSNFYSVSYDQQFKVQVDMIKEKYHEKENVELTMTKGKSAVDKLELLEMIYKLDVRAKAICLLSLITASRPSEMVVIKIKHFDLEARNLGVYLIKQKKWTYKRLDLETVKAIREYIKEYKLTEEDYFVGRKDKHENFYAVEVSETAYRNMLKRWTGLSPYNFRKTQVSSMHKKGADLPTIAKQTGHQSLQTLNEHYLNVSDETIDKYL